MWKVRYIAADGDLTEADFDGPLADIGKQFDEDSIRVLQHVPSAPRGSVDQARGADSMTITKSDVFVVSASDIFSNPPG